MNLKDKFSNYQSEPNQAAWEHFQSLKKKKKERGGFFFFLRRGGGAVIGVAVLTLLVTYYGKQNAITAISQHAVKAVQETAQEISATKVEQKKSKEPVFETKKQKEHTTNNPKTTNPLLGISDNLLADKRENNFLNGKAHNKDAKLLSATTISKQEASNFVEATNIKTSVNVLSNKNLPRPTKEKSEEKIINNNNLAPLQNAEKETLAMLPTIEWSPIFPLNKITPISTASTPIIKKYKPKKNSLKITVGYADGFINGFTLAEDQPVDKRGFAVEASYYRNVSKLVGIGLSLGYMKGIDKENPQLMIKDKESIQFLHANLYLFLVNERRHRLYGKIGAGPTKTDRILGTFFIDQAANIFERRFQINTLRGLGVSVEGAYEFQVHPQLWIGSNYSIISHNDGGWYLGFSINRKF